MEGTMATWSDMEREAPEIAAAGRSLLYQYGDPYAFLSTLRKDGAPRLHPICPVVAEGSLWAFIVKMGYKYRDLLRDGRYALHAFPAPGGGEEFYLAGTARPESGAQLRSRVVDATGGRLGSHEFEAMFELGIDHALHTKWTGWGTAETWPTFAKWRAAGTEGH
jgi:hypothetical protein